MGEKELKGVYPDETRLEVHFARFTGALQAPIDALTEICGEIISMTMARAKSGKAKAEPKKGNKNEEPI